MKEIGVSIYLMLKRWVPSINKEKKFNMNKENNKRRKENNKTIIILMKKGFT